MSPLALCLATEPPRPLKQVMRWNSARVRDSIAMHADDERELGFEPAIASLSFGRPATLKFGPKKGRPGARLSLTLAPGSLLIMRGQTQRNYKHGIAKSPRPDDRNRLNITFRTIYT